MRLNLSEKQAQEILPGFHGKFVHSDSMTLAYWEIEGGSELPTHNHIHEQVLNMISGEFEFTMNGEVQVLRAGDVVVIPSDVPHSGKYKKGHKRRTCRHPCPVAGANDPAAAGRKTAPCRLIERRRRWRAR